jgi:hypothetical protein
VPRKKNKHPDPFAKFKIAAENTFKFLLDDFDFELVETFQHMPDCVLEYRNSTTAIEVRYEYTSQVAVTFKPLVQKGSESLRGKPYDLMLLMEIRAPHINLNQFYGTDKQWSPEYIQELLEQYAGFLKEQAADVLTGDFSFLPDFKKLYAQRSREANKESFGTYTGISPRFVTRPTLQEVFAIAKVRDPSLDILFGGKLDQDKTAGCIYEAFWDHGYSTNEIAQFLNTSENSIQEILDEYDDRL